MGEEYMASTDAKKSGINFLVYERGEVANGTGVSERKRFESVDQFRCASSHKLRR